MLKKFTISIIGKTGVGKSNCVASLVGDLEIKSSMLGDNFLGKTKTNVKYLLYKEKIKTDISVEINRAYVESLIQYSKSVNENGVEEEKAIYLNLIENVKNIFKGINIEHICQEDIISEICKKIKDYIDNEITEDNYINIFNSNLDYANFITNVIIITEMSSIAKKMLDVEVLECVDTRGVFDSDDKIKRLIPNTTATMLLVNGNGESKETIEMMCDRISDVFRKPVSLMVRDNGYDLDQEYTLEEEVLRYQNEKNEYEEYGESLKNIMQAKGYLPQENSIKTNDIYYNLLANNKVNVIPTMGKKRNKEFKKFDWDVYTTIVCKSINQIITVYLEIQEASKKVVDKWKKDTAISQTIYEIIWSIAKNSSIDICNGKIKGLHQQPRNNTMVKNAEAKHNYSNAKSRYSTIPTYEWIEEYIHHYVTVSAAEVLGELNDKFVGELENIKFANISKMELLLLIRAIYQHTCNLIPSKGYKWFSTFINEVRVGSKSYNAAEIQLDNLFKKYNGGNFYYIGLENEKNYYAISVMLCLIYHSACDEVAKFADDEDSLKAMVKKEVFK